MEEQAARRALGRIFALRLPRSWEDLDLERFPVANYIVFSEVLESSREASRDRLGADREHLKGRGIEALFMMDEEGGRVTQTSGFFHSAPSPRAIAKTLKPRQACELYAQLGAFLGDLGIDIDLAPCLDVATEEVNPIIGTRAFAADPETVSGFGEAAISGLQRSVSAVGKHFPGHGMTRLDSHLALPVVDDSRETLERVHGLPFRRAIAQGVAGIMASHCSYPAIQTDGLPASLSGQIVRNYLRGKLGYDGPVITDSLDMKAITENLSPQEAALKAFEASCDILLYTEIGERFETAFAALLDLMVHGRLDREQLARGSERRERLLARRAARLERRERPGAAGQPGVAYDPAEYLRLTAAARDCAIRLEGTLDLLPLERDTLVVGTAGRALRRIAGMGIEVRALSGPGAGATGATGAAGLLDAGAPDASGRDLLLWLAEPLTLGRSLEDLRAVARAARDATLVTTYNAVAKALPECRVRVVTDDLSPAAEDSIIARLFAIPPG